MALGPLIRSNMRSMITGTLGRPLSLLQAATAYLGGNAPSYWLDMTNNRALMNSVDVGTVSSGVTVTSGTLALSAAGHTVSSTSNVLVIPVSVVPPFVLFVEAIRTADSGLSERFVQMDDGTEIERAVFLVSNVDTWRLQHVTAGTTDFNLGTAVTAVLGTTYKAAARFQVNSMNGSVNGSIGTTDTVCATNVTMTALRIGAGVANTEPATGAIIRKVGIIPVGSTNAQLQAMTA